MSCPRPDKLSWDPLSPMAVLTNPRASAALVRAMDCLFHERGSASLGPEPLTLNIGETGRQDRLRRGLAAVNAIEWAQDPEDDETVYVRCRRATISELVEDRAEEVRAGRLSRDESLAEWLCRACGYSSAADAMVSLDRAIANLERRERERIQSDEVDRLIEDLEIEVDQDRDESGDYGTGTDDD